MSRKLRVGVIGTGFGALVQVPGFRANPRVEVVALASGRPGRAREVAHRLGVPSAFDDWRALVDAELDLVSVTAPPDLHRPMALAALGRRRHILCEKPMALSAEEAEEMARAADAAGVAAVIDHELRVNPNRRRVAALLANGYVGRPRQALITLILNQRADPTRPWNWWSDARQGGGLLGAVGSHQVDLLRYWLGEIEAVTGGIETFISQRPDPEGHGVRPVTSDDSTAFMLRFASGAVATVVLSVVATRPLGPRIEVWGDEGVLWLDEREGLWGARGSGTPEELTEAETRTAPPDMEYAPLWGLSFVRLVDHLVASILDGSPLAPLATFHDGLATQRVLDAVRRASLGWIRP